MTVYIETDRLLLRDWQDEDLKLFQEMNANPQVRRHFSSLLSYQRSKNDMKNMAKVLEETGIGLFAVELKETGAWLGFIGLNYVTEKTKYTFKELPFYEIGWRLIPEVWGNGLATEGAEAVLKYARSKGINELYAFTTVSNAASRKVMEKIGMKIYDHFKDPEVSPHHHLSECVRYYRDLSLLH
ncbi:MULTISPECIES: GNAT family N-acetyltransferase [unclassified Staphylococcus]|uniref:GNAT family N-acetyltransferase n=1 Tax=unclassified Staphylococcus TaxID=91994 RepID=UPI00203C5A99|nr:MULTISPECIES: GNAT family N-acetyltransferase [unclassified Staphylococcus]